MIFFRIKYFPCEKRRVEKFTILDSFWTNTKLYNFFKILHSAIKFKLHFIPINSHVFCSLFWFKTGRVLRSWFWKYTIIFSHQGSQNNIQWLWNSLLSVLGEIQYGKIFNMLLMIKIQLYFQKIKNNKFWNHFAHHSDYWKREKNRNLKKCFWIWILLDL